MNRIKNLKFKFKLKLMQYPDIYFSVYKIFGKRKDLLVSQNTEIVIEGYPRSANTYAVVAFSMAQGRSIKIAHHLHTPDQIIKAIKWNIPSIVLIRNPEDAILSLVIRHPEISIKNAIMYYIHFYQPLIRYFEKIYIAKFEDVVSDFGKVIIGFNEKFNLNYVPYEKNTQSEEKIFKTIDKLNLEQDGGLETKVARPLTRKKMLKERLKNELFRPKYYTYLKDAKEIYKNFINR